MRSLRMIRHLMRPAFVLAAHRTLVPEGFESALPPLALYCARCLQWLMPSARQARGLRFGQRLALALTRLGPTYIKLGQFLAARADVTGAEIADDLALLQDRLPAFPLDIALGEIERAFKLPASALFRRIEPAIAAASIAQVHPAEIDDGAGGVRKVAVKVLRPKIAQQFARDLDAFARLADWLLWLKPSLKRLKPDAVVAELQRSIAQELDLRLEAAAAAEMADGFALDAVFTVPKPDWDRTARNVLTAEWVEGTPLHDRAALNARGIDLKALATTLIQVFLRQALKRGFFHADMHPGNLFADMQGRLVAVDYGIMGRLDSAMRRFMAETLSGFLDRDYRRVAAIHFAVGFVRAPHTADGFAQALRAVGEPIFGRSASTMSIAKLLEQLLDVTRQFGMELQPQLLLLQKTMVVVEGVARQLDPQHSIWESARPIVEAWMIDNLGPEARLRGAAENVGAFGRAVGALPEVLRGAEGIVAQLTAEGLKLHPETAQAIADAQSQRNAPLRWAIWIGAGALAVLAYAQM